MSCLAQHFLDFIDLVGEYISASFRNVAYSILYICLFLTNLRGVPKVFLKKMAKEKRR